MQDLTFVVGEDRSVAEIWEALGSVNIEMEAATTYPRLEGRIVHVVVSDDVARKAYDTLREKGFLPLDRREVLIADIVVQPGEMGRIAREIADAGAKLYVMFMASNNRVVIGASDLAKAAKALGVSSD